MRPYIDWLVRRSPAVAAACTEALYWYRRCRARGGSREALFTYFYRHRAWGGTESASGPGSDLAQTARLIAALPGLLREWGVQTLLDVPCGDFHWMSRVDLSGVRYFGGDLVPELVQRNQQYRSATVTFDVLDLLADPLPRADLILCRDCLVHLSYRDARRAIANMCRSGCTLLLTTTYPRHGRNLDIRTGGWRPLNLQAAPFQFPSPRRLVEEGSTEGRDYADKSLGLWDLADLRQYVE